MKCSIVIPTYSRASFIEKTINSVLNQTYKNFELLIVDDNSTDNTEDLIKKATKCILFNFIKTND